MEEEAETDFSSFKTKNANSKNSTANMLILDFISHNCERKNLCHHTSSSLWNLVTALGNTDFM